jgi:hypothetical protein
VAHRLAQGLSQSLQKPLTTPQHRSKARQMVTVRLTVHEVKMPGVQGLYEMHEGNFRGVRAPGKHGFAKKGRAQGDAVEAAD